MKIKGTVVRVTPATDFSYSYEEKFTLARGLHKAQIKHEYQVIEFIIAVKEETGERLVQITSYYEPARASIKEGDPVTIHYVRHTKAGYGDVSLDLEAMAAKRCAADQPKT